MAVHQQAVLKRQSSYCAVHEVGSVTTGCGVGNGFSIELSSSRRALASARNATMTGRMAGVRARATSRRELVGDLGEAE